MTTPPLFLNMQCSETVTGAVLSKAWIIYAKKTKKKTNWRIITVKKDTTTRNNGHALFFNMLFAYRFPTCTSECIYITSVLTKPCRLH